MQLITTELPKGDFRSICEELGIQNLTLTPSPKNPGNEVSKEEFIDELKKEKEV